MALTDFQKAFAMARKKQGAGGEFDFGGERFNTNYAKENNPQPITARDARTEVMQSHNIAPKSPVKEEIIDAGLDSEEKSETEKEDNNSEMASAIGDLFAGPKQQASQAEIQAINPQTRDMMQARRQALMNLIKGR